MFELKVTNLSTAMQTRNNFTKVISLLDLNMANKWEFKNTKNQHTEFFKDICFMHPNQVYPSKEHICRILKFSDNFIISDKVLVHCHAGISRSTAVAIGILVKHGMTVDDAFEYVGNMRPQMRPNPLIIRHLDALLDLNNSLIKRLEKFDNNYIVQVMQV